MERSWPKIIIHADMDAFYAAVEQLDDPSLKGKPVLIGPNSYRGVVLTASYEARPFGVGSAMPMGEARRRCPNAVIVSPRFERYQQVSEQMMDIFADFSPYVEALSLDEAFLEMSGAEHIFGSPRQMGLKIKEAVRDVTHLDISVGISGTKYVAKVASAYDKPNGLMVVPQDQAKAWLAPQPITRLWGVGKKTAPKLEALGFKTIGELAAAEPRYLAHKMGVSGAHFFELANARDPRRVSRGRTAKSIGSDRTLSKDVTTREEIEVHLRRSAERISRRVRGKNYVAGGIRIRLKTNRFEMFTRQRHFSKPVDTAEAFFTMSRRLLAELGHSGPFRLVGMAAFDLGWREEPLQLDMFEDSTHRDLETTIDNLIERFGKGVVVRGRDLAHSGTISANGVNLDFLDYRDGERVSRPE
jgi:DNA polymerase-4